MISSLHARGGTRIYAKAVAGGPARGDPVRGGVAGAGARPRGDRRAGSRWPTGRRPGSAGADRALVTGELSRPTRHPRRHAPCRTTRPTVPPDPRRLDDPPMRRAPVALAGADPGLVGRAGRRAGSRRAPRRAGSAARRQLLGGPQPGPAPGRDPRRRPAARRGRGRHGQDAGGHPPDRLAHRDPPGPAVGDPGLDVHGQGRRGDAGPGRPARAVRLHGHADLDVPRVRRPPHPRVRPRARARRPTSASCPGRRWSSSCASTCSSFETSSTTARSATRPASSAPWPRISAGSRTRTSIRRTTWPRPSARSPRRRCPPSCAEGDGRDRDDAARRPRPPWRRRRRQLELARAFGRYQALLRGGRVHRLRRPGGARRSGCCASSPAARAEVRRRYPVHPRRRVPGHEPGAGRARRPARRPAPERHGRRRRRPVDLPVPRRGDEQHRRVPGAAAPTADRRPAPELPVAGGDPRRPATG